MLMRKRRNRKPASGIESREALQAALQHFETPPRWADDESRRKYETVVAPALREACKVFHVKQPEWLDIAKSQLKLDFHLEGGTGSSHRGAKRKPGAKRPRRSEASPQTGTRQTYRDGRLVPIVGDEVYQVARGMFGLPANLRGTVYRTGKTLRVRITQSGDLLGGRSRYSTYRLDEAWTVVGDPEVMRRKNAAAQRKREAEEARQGALEADAKAAAMMRQRFLENGCVPLTHENAMVGLTVRGSCYGEESVRIITDIDDNGIYGTEPDELQESGRSLGLLDMWVIDPKKALVDVAAVRKQIEDEDPRLRRERAWEQTPTVKDALGDRKTVQVGTLTTADGEEFRVKLGRRGRGGHSPFDWYVDHGKGKKEWLRVYGNAFSRLGQMHQALLEVMLEGDNPGLQFEPSYDAARNATRKPTPPKRSARKRTTSMPDKWRAELKRLSAKRFQTHAEERQIARMKKLVAADPSKWRQGDGVGWRVTDSQINRGFRVLAVDAKQKMVRIHQVADTGITVTGGNDDRIEPQWVPAGDLIRDNKYTSRATISKAATTVQRHLARSPKTKMPHWVREHIRRYDSADSAQEAGLAENATFLHAPIDRIDPNPFQNRQEFDDTAMRGLAESIRTQGLLQPITVRIDPTDPSRMQIIGGERRYRACKLLGKDSIPALLYPNKDDGAMAVLAMTENEARADTNPLEQAEGYHRLLTDLGMSVGEIASHVGVTPATIERKLSFVGLDDQVKDALKRGHIKEMVAAQIARLDDKNQQVDVMLMAIGKGLKPADMRAIVNARMMDVGGPGGLFAEDRAEEVRRAEEREYGRYTRVARKRWDKAQRAMVDAVWSMIDDETYKLLPAVLEGNVGASVDSIDQTIRALEKMKSEMKKGAAYLQQTGSMAGYMRKQNIKAKMMAEKEEKGQQREALRTMERRISSLLSTQKILPLLRRKPENFTSNDRQNWKRWEEQIRRGIPEVKRLRQKLGMKPRRFANVDRVVAKQKEIEAYKPRRGRKMRKGFATVLYDGRPTRAHMHWSVSER